MKQETSFIELSIDAITVNTSAQSRNEIDMALVAEYAELMRNGVIFPPLTVFFDGATHWLSEGFHRIAAYREAAFSAVPCHVMPGGLREAILLSVGSNAEHGKRRSNEDKRRAVEMLLKDETWRGWSDREIGKQCAVDHKTVAKVRETYLGISQDAPSLGISPVSEGRTYTTKHGTPAKMKTDNIGKIKAVDAPEPVVDRDFSNVVVTWDDPVAVPDGIDNTDILELIRFHNIPAEHHAELIEAAKGWAANSDASNREGTSIKVKGFAWWDVKSGNALKRRNAIDEKAKHDRLVNKFGAGPYETTLFGFVEKWRDGNSGSALDIMRCSEHFNTLSREYLDRLKNSLLRIRQKHIEDMDKIIAKIDDLLVPVAKDITPNQATKFLEDKSTD